MDNLTFKEWLKDKIDGDVREVKNNLSSVIIHELSNNYTKKQCTSTIIMAITYKHYILLPLWLKNRASLKEVKTIVLKKERVEYANK